MPGHDIIVVGASAGGVEALTRLVAELPADLPAALFVVLHIPPYNNSVLPNILSRSGPLPACHPRDNEPIQHGHIYIAPPDHHLLVQRGHIRLTRDATENGLRPSVDPMFRSAAHAYGPRVVGVILSGVLDDGTAGLMVIKRHGGLAVVQHPEDALFPGMALSAIENVTVDEILPLADIPPLLVNLAHEPVSTEGESVVAGEIEYEQPDPNLDVERSDEGIGIPSVYSCPECHGTLWEVRDEELIRFRCRVGHAYSADSLLAQQCEQLEAALWSAYRALKESAALARRLAERALLRNHSLSAERFGAQASDAEERANLIQNVLLRGELSAPSEPPLPSEVE